MAGGMDLGSGGGRGKRSLDASLNLVPFIDLMAVTVVFLIMTAVWTQLGGLKASSSPSGPCTGACETAGPALGVRLTGSSVAVSLADVPVFSSPLTRTSSGRLELSPLRAFLAAWKSHHDEAVSAHLAPDDDVAAQDVVQVMDVLSGAGLADVSLE